MSGWVVAAMGNFARVEGLAQLYTHRFVPDASDGSPLGDELRVRNESPGPGERKVVGAPAKGPVGRRELGDGRLRNQVRGGNGFELPDGVREQDHRRVVLGPPKRPVLRQELDIRDAPRVLP